MVLRSSQRLTWGLIACAVLTVYGVVCPSICFAAVETEQEMAMPCHDGNDTSSPPEEHHNRSDSCCDNHESVMLSQGKHKIELSVDHSLESSMLLALEVHHDFPTLVNHIGKDPPGVQASAPVYLRTQSIRI